MVLRGIQCFNPNCEAEYFRPFSCKVFYPLGGQLHRLCPSCSQKRTLPFGEYMNEQLLLVLPHRQMVFTPRSCASSSATTGSCTARSPA